MKLQRSLEERDVATLEERRRDAHEKIQLGGIVVKAGLRGVDKGVLLGALLDLADLDPESEGYKRLKEVGDAEFKRQP